MPTSKEIAYYGAFISRENASNWIVKYSRMKEYLLNEPLIHIDEITIQVMWKEKRSNKQKAYKDHNRWFV